MGRAARLPRRAYTEGDVKLRRATPAAARHVNARLPIVGAEDENLGGGLLFGKRVAKYHHVKCFLRRFRLQSGRRSYFEHTPGRGWVFRLRRYRIV